ncbi:Carboxylesterase 4A [Saguinus oedipus]|uniref:Carboxylesterase 4A n=1 Tax=Saguinus oedipus TaxID=9490 RepID=A0ABQ9TKE0_SAGOE|nr:Carboxylesterase 4A [Saguinus oedipus]
MKFPLNRQVMRKETIARMLWSTRTLLVRSPADRGAQPKTPGGLSLDPSHWWAHLWPSWHPGLNRYGLPTQNITKEQIPLVVEEYMDNINEHDWKMLRNRMMDIVEDAAFVYATLKTAHYHRDASLPVYLYEFERYACGMIVKPRTDGADHGDEMYFLFGGPFATGAKAPPDTPTGCPVPYLFVQTHPSISWPQGAAPQFLMWDALPNESLLLQRQQQQQE